MCHNVPFFHSYVKQPEGNFSTTTMWTATKKPEARGSQKEAFFIPHGLTHGEFHPDEFSSLAHLFPSEKITGWRCQTQVTASSGLKMWGDDQEILPWGWQVDYHGGNRVPIGLVVSFCFVGETIPQKDTETETRISRSQNNDIEIDWIQNFRLFYLWLVFFSTTSTNDDSILDEMRSGSWEDLSGYVGDGRPVWMWYFWVEGSLKKTRCLV